MEMVKYGGGLRRGTGTERPFFICQSDPLLTPVDPKYPEGVCTDVPENLVLKNFLWRDVDKCYRWAECQNWKEHIAARVYWDPLTLGCGVNSETGHELTGLWQSQCGRARDRVDDQSGGSDICRSECMPFEVNYPHDREGGGSCDFDFLTP